MTSKWGAPRFYLLLATVSLAGCDQRQASPALTEIGWSTDPATIRRQLIESQAIEERDGDWSPVVVEGDRRFRAIWYAPHDRDLDARIWLGSDDQVERVSYTGPMVEPFITEGNTRDLLEAVAPRAPVGDRESAAKSMANLLRAGGKAEVEIGPLVVRGTSGYTHMTVSAAPAG